MGNLSDDPRMNVYFRIRKLREMSPHEGSRRVGHGVNDHPDRGAYGQWLEYPKSYDPWKLSLDAMCDHWSEWEGMRHIVSNARFQKNDKKTMTMCQLDMSFCYIHLLRCMVT